jgi:hypothetical protein
LSSFASYSDCDGKHVAPVHDPYSLNAFPVPQHAPDEQLSNSRGDIGPRPREKLSTHIFSIRVQIGLVPLGEILK